MQTLSSASRTCMASASAVECTATVLMPISRQARWMRSAISPRLAIRIFSNIDSKVRRRGAEKKWNADKRRSEGMNADKGLIAPAARSSPNLRLSAASSFSAPLRLCGENLLSDDHQDFAVFDRTAVAEEDFLDRAAMGGGDRVHHLHGLDDQQGLALGDLVADLHERRGTRFRRGIGGADHGRRHGTRRGTFGAPAAAVAPAAAGAATATPVPPRLTRMRCSPTSY